MLVAGVIGRVPDTFPLAQPVVVSAETVNSGTCGDNVSWVIDGEGTLTISGSGDMSNYSSSSSGRAPWYSERSEIKTVVIMGGITSIGNYSFYGCSNLTNVTISDSVTSIGNYAFYKCTRLTSAILPDSVTSIGSGAFSDCTSLTSITIPDSVTSTCN